MDYATHLDTPQSEALPGQVENSAGGFSFTVDPFERLRRFLILGAEGGTYYTKEGPLVRENLKAIHECLAEDPERTAEEICDIWNQGRAARPDPVMLSLALCTLSPRAARIVENRFNNTVRTGFHLFRFAHYVNELRGWGRRPRRMIRGWYLSKTTENVDYQRLKYIQREGWSHRDLLRLTHPKNGRLNHLFRAIVQGRNDPFEGLGLDECIQLIKESGRISHEMLTPELKKRTDVWQALLPFMPYQATLKHLGALSAREVLGPGRWDANKIVENRLTDTVLIKRSRIHPIQLLSALKTYKQGKGVRGSLKWEVDAGISAAVEEAFSLSFDQVKPSGKRFLLGLDVSGSMTWADCAGVVGVTCREAAAAMLLVTMRTEPLCVPMAFTHIFSPLSVTRDMTYTEVLRKTSKLPFGGTDCAQPMTYALRKNIEVDAFVVYTDNQTWAGGIHPKAALDKYRRKLNPNAKLIVVSMLANNFSIADPNDPGMLDVVGFDPSVPSVLREFVTG